MNYQIIKFLSLFSKRFENINADKKEIRQHIRQLKKQISREQKQLEADAVFDKIESLPEFKMAKTILMYWSTSDELPTQSIINKWCKQKQITLPAIDGEKLVLKRYSPQVKLIQKNLGIWEPDLSENYEGKIDLVIVPGIAFDWKKNRLGRGKGYYDRFFKKYKPLKIGVGFDFQLMDSIPATILDVKMNKIITPSETIE